MLEIKFSPLGSVNEKDYTRVVMVAEYNNKWVFCKKWNKDTWELPGGHIEEDEDALTAAHRELKEETGGTAQVITPICVYTLSTPGLLCYVKIDKLEPLPKLEIEKIDLFDALPSKLSYPDWHPKMFEKVLNYLKENK